MPGIEEKRKQIREGVNDILKRYGNYADGYDADGDELDIDGALGAIFSCLHSEDVVIKVDKELPAPHKSYSLGEGYKIVQQDMLDAGYVATEPLTEA